MPISPILCPRMRIIAPQKQNIASGRGFALPQAPYNAGSFYDAPQTPTRLGRGKGKFFRPQPSRSLRRLDHRVFGALSGPALQYFPQVGAICRSCVYTAYIVVYYNKLETTG